MSTKKVLEPEWLCPADESRRRLAAELAVPGAATALDAVLRLDTAVLMPEDPVKRVDNITMAWGLEARVPFLDQDLVALAAACSARNTWRACCRTPITPPPPPAGHAVASGRAGDVAAAPRHRQLTGKTAQGRPPAPPP